MSSRGGSAIRSRRFRSIATRRAPASARPRVSVSRAEPRSPREVSAATPGAGAVRRGGRPASRAAARRAPSRAARAAARRCERAGRGSRCRSWMGVPPRERARRGEARRWPGAAAALRRGGRSCSDGLLRQRKLARGKSLLRGAARADPRPRPASTAGSNAAHRVCARRSREAVSACGATACYLPRPGVGCAQP
jgi:hypothetical protein